MTIVKTNRKEPADTRLHIIKFTADESGDAEKLLCDWVNKNDVEVVAITMGEYVAYGYSEGPYHFDLFFRFKR
jgi:hypothetical protein